MGCKKRGESRDLIDLDHSTRLLLLACWTLSPAPSSNSRWAAATCGRLEGEMLPDNPIMVTYV